MKRKRCGREGTNCSPHAVEVWISVWAVYQNLLLRQESGYARLYTLPFMLEFTPRFVECVVIIFNAALYISGHTLSFFAGHCKRSRLGVGVALSKLNLIGQRRLNAYIWQEKSLVNFDLMEKWRT